MQQKSSINQVYSFRRYHSVLYKAFTVDSIVPLSLDVLSILHWLAQTFLLPSFCEPKFRWRPLWAALSAGLVFLKIWFACYLNKWAPNLQLSCSTLSMFLVIESRYAAWSHCRSKQDGPLNYVKNENLVQNTWVHMGFMYLGCKTFALRRFECLYLGYYIKLKSLFYNVSLKKIP